MPLILFDYGGFFAALQLWSLFVFVQFLEAGVTALQKTLVLKKQAELDEMEKRLALKRQDSKACMEALAQRRSELELKLQQVS